MTIYNVRIHKIFKILIIIGDWGRKTNNLINVAKSMDKLSQSYKPYFILSLGDNFYPNGVKDSNDPKWNELYTDIFTGKYLFCPMIMLVITIYDS